MDPAPAPDPPGPVFVGGCPRSGTTIVGRLIGAHPRYAAVPVEARFHAEPGGLPDLIAGEVTLEQFCERLRNHWYSRRAPDGSRRGFPDLLSAEELERVLASFRARYAQEPVAAARELTASVLDRVAAAEGKPGWVEMTPWTAARAPALLEMFPGSRFVHVIRDGRDVACSVLGFFWGPETIGEAIEWWAERLRGSAAGTRRIPPERVLVIELEELVERDRDGSYARLLEFLSADDDAGMHSFFDSEVSAEGAHLGRWRRELSRSDRAEAERAYERNLAALRQDGCPVPSPDRRPAAGS